MIEGGIYSSSESRKEKYIYIQRKFLVIKLIYKYVIKYTRYGVTKQKRRGVGQ